jgi:hypothetical protein
MIACRALATGKEDIFAWHLDAEAEGIPPGAIPARQPELERLLLQAFLRYVEESPRTWWLHWDLRSIQYGFPALAQRAKALGLGKVSFPDRRMIDLAAVLKQALGDDYVAHRRLQSLIELNGINDYELLDVPGLTAAFRAGDYARMLRSLRRKLHCLKCIVELVARGALRTAGPPFVLPSAAEGRGKAGWMASARVVLDAGRLPLPSPTPKATEAIAAAVPPQTPPAASAATAPAGARNRGQDAGAAGRQLSPTERHILSHCRRKAHTGERIAHHLGLSYDHVRRVLARLVREERLRVTADGYRTVRAT